MKLNNYPGVAEVAMQSGWHSARTIVRRLRGRAKSRPFVYRDFGTVATIARFRAVADLGWLRLTGAPAWIFWLVVHLTFLTGFKNRLAALTTWGVRVSGPTSPTANHHAPAGRRSECPRVGGPPESHARCRSNKCPMKSTLTSAGEFSSRTPRSGVVVQTLKDRVNARSDQIFRTWGKSSVQPLERLIGPVTKA